MGLPHYGPVTRSPSFSDGFVNGLQNGKFPSRPAIQATGLGLLPRWDLLPLIMPAFAGRTVFWDRSIAKAALPLRAYVPFKVRIAGNPTGAAAVWPGGAPSCSHAANAAET